jgi:hypothetical protein
MTTSPNPAAQSVAQQAPIKIHSHHNSAPNKIKNQVQSSTDFKIRRDVTPMHHDPMVINFSRLRRPNQVEERACR